MHFKKHMPCIQADDYTFCVAQIITLYVSHSFMIFFPKIFLKLDFQNKAKTNVVCRLGMAVIMILSNQITPLFSN